MTLTSSAIPEEKPNIIFITADTVRQDRLGAYGYPGSTTPNLDIFSKDAVQFMNAFTPIPLTTPSHASIFSSMYPTKHGVFTNGALILIKEALLAEILEKNLYQTAAFISCVFTEKRTGLGRGFGTFGGFPAGKKGSVLNLTSKELRSVLALQGKAEDTTQEALSWLGTSRKESQPFFMWLHYYDAHHPYLPSQEWVKDTPVDQPEWERLNEVLHLNKGVAAFSHGERGLVDKLYDGEIRYIDHQIGRILSYLKTNGLYENSVIVFMSDHGEVLGEKENFYGHHEYVYDGSIRVPLMIKFPGIAHEKIDGLVSTMDVMPSLLSYIKVKDPFSASRDGVSILPLLAGRTKEIRRAVYLSAYYFDELYFREQISSEPSDRHDIEQKSDHGILTRRWKYWTAGEKRLTTEFLFDLESDPIEENNLAGGAPRKVEELKQLLKPYRDAAYRKRRVGKSPASMSKDISERVKELKSLGYL